MNIIKSFNNTIDYEDSAVFSIMNPAAGNHNSV